MFFVAGDVITTYAGLYHQHGVVEASYVPSMVLSAYGFGGLIALKLLLVAFAILMYRVSGRPYNVGIPLGIMFWGFIITVWNMHIILS